MKPADARAHETVVFVDLGTMLSFDQLALGLRERGVHVVHVTRARNFLARLTSRVVYDETHWFETHDDLVRALAGLDPSSVIDIQSPEFLIGDVIAAANRVGIPSPVVSALEERFAWRDKARVSNLLREAGVPVPRSIVIEDEPAAQRAVEELGLPVTLKRRVGSGGEGVRIARSTEEVTAMVADLGAGPDQLFAEEFLPGRTVCWAGVLHQGSVLEGVVYETLQSRGAEGPSTTIHVLRDETISRIGAQLAALVSQSGLVNLDLVEDRDGRPRVVDVNLRAWHSVVALGAVGHTFVDSYLNSLRGEDRRTGPSPHGGRPMHLRVFPDQAARLDRPVHDLALFFSDAWHQRTVLPLRYRAIQTLLFLRRLSQRGC